MLFVTPVQFARYLVTSVSKRLLFRIPRIGNADFLCIYSSFWCSTTTTFQRSRDDGESAIISTRVIGVQRPLIDSIGYDRWLGRAHIFWKVTFDKIIVKWCVRVNCCRDSLSCLVIGPVSA